jgi:hypothetical protein
MARVASALPRRLAALATALVLGLGVGAARADQEAEPPSLRWELVAVPPVRVAAVTGEGALLPSRAPSLALRWRPSERSTFAVSTELGDARRDERPPAPLLAAPRARDVELSASWLHGLSRGTLLRTQLDAQSSVALRLRGRAVGVYLSVKLGERD